MAKEKTKALAKIDDFKLAQFSVEEVKGVIQDCLGNDDFSPADLDRVSVPSGGGTAFQVPTLEGKENMDELEGIILHVASTRAYWKEAYSGAGSPPDCASRDGFTGIGEPGGMCRKCPMNKFGSGDNNSKACKEMRLVFLLRPDTVLPMVIIVPPSSIKHIKKYVVKLANNVIRQHAVMTKFTLEQTKSKTGITYSEIIPAMVSKLDPEAIEAVETHKANLGPIFEAEVVAHEEMQAAE